MKIIALKQVKGVIGETVTNFIIGVRFFHSFL